MEAFDILEIGSKLIVIFLCTPVHEFAHAWAANKLGDDTPVYQGRLTLNPLAHIDPIGAIGILFCGFGWGKPVNVNPLRFKEYRKGMMLTALAGPVSNFILAFFCTILYKTFWAVYLTEYNIAMYWVAYIFMIIGSINLGLAAFNLIPIYPLDGEKIFAYFFGNINNAKINSFMSKYGRYITIGFFLLIFTGLLDRPLGILQSAFAWLLDKLTFWLDPLLRMIF